MLQILCVLHQLAAYVTRMIGKTIALWNLHNKHFVRMSSAFELDKSAQSSDGSLPSTWTWELFKVMDAGDGMVALYNLVQKRFISMPEGQYMEKSPERPDRTLPSTWGWAVFRVVHVHTDIVAFYNPSHKRFMRMMASETKIDKSPVQEDGTLPSDWGAERFKIVESQQEPGGAFAFTNTFHRTRPGTGTICTHVHYVYFRW